MLRNQRLEAVLATWTLPLSLILQALLLLPAINLLPVWGDEFFTLQAVGRPASGVWQVYAADAVNPPLHGLLLHFWLMLPWPLGKVMAARALSVVLALFSTVAIDRVLLRDLSPKCRAAGLTLWALSPCVLLYARMARAYSMQVLLFVLAFAAAWTLLRQPRGLRPVLVFAGLEALLLYTHYVPALALLTGCFTYAVVKTIRDKDANKLVRLAASAALAAALYIPWMQVLWNSLLRVATADSIPGGVPALIGVMAEPGYTFFSFNFGETPPLWVLLSSLAAAPCILALIWRSLRHPPDWLWLLIPVALVAWAGASRWVEFPFLPARIMFLLPFMLALFARGLERGGRPGWAVWAAMLILSLGSADSYYRRADFLNKGYLLPYGEMVSTIRGAPAGGPVMVVADGCNLDPWPLLSEVGDVANTTLARREDSLESLLGRVGSEASVIWYLRSTHDRCPGELNRRLEAELAASRQIRRYFYVPYSRRDQYLMQLLGWRERPTHYAELLEMRKK
jgi:hypothetical protein